MPRKKFTMAPDAARRRVECGHYDLNGGAPRCAALTHPWCLAPGEAPESCRFRIPKTTEPPKEPEPAPKMKPEPAPKMEPEPTPKMEPEPTPKMEPEPTLKMEPEPTLKMEPEPTLKMEPEPTLKTPKKKRTAAELPEDAAHGETD